MNCTFPPLTHSCYSLSFQQYISQRIEKQQIKPFQLSKLTGLSPAHITKLKNIQDGSSLTTVKNPTRKTVLFILLALGEPIEVINYYLQEMNYKEISSERLERDIDIFEEYVERLSKNFAGFYPLKTGLNFNLIQYAMGHLKGNYKAYNHNPPIVFRFYLEQAFLKKLQDHHLINAINLDKLNANQYIWLCDKNLNSIRMNLLERRLEAKAQLIIENYISEYIVSSIELKRYLYPLVDIIKQIPADLQGEFFAVIQYYLQSFYQENFFRELTTLRLTKARCHFSFLIKEHLIKNQLSKLLCYVINFNHDHYDYREHELIGYVANDVRLIQNFEEQWEELNLSCFSSEELSIYQQHVKEVIDFKSFEQLMLML